MSYYRVELIDYSDYTWNTDVFYKNQYIDSLNREEFEEFIGMLAAYTASLNVKYNADFHSSGCELTHPFEVNCHMYNAEKLASLMTLLNNQYDHELEAWMRSTLDFEKEQYEIFKQASKKEEFNQYFESLNEENTLKFVLRELNVEKTIDLKFIKTFNTGCDQYIEQLDKEKERLPELYEDSKSWSNQHYEYILELRKKYESMMKKIESLKNL